MAKDDWLAIGALDDKRRAPHANAPVARSWAEVPALCVKVLAEQRQDVTLGIWWWDGGDGWTKNPFELVGIYFDGVVFRKEDA